MWGGQYAGNTRVRESSREFAKSLRPEAELSELSDTDTVASVVRLSTLSRTARAILRVWVVGLGWPFMWHTLLFLLLCTGSQCRESRLETSRCIIQNPYATQPVPVLRGRAANRLIDRDP